MNGFIDMHSHILPATDDGPVNSEQAVRMIEIASEEGIATIVATPHYREGYYEEPADILKDRLKKLKKDLGNIMPGISINILLGSEIYYSHESVGLLNRGIIPTLAGSRCILVEFSPRAESGYIKNALQELIMEGYNPIIAHLERHENITKDLGRVRELISMGANVQVNAGSITGENGRRCKRTAKSLLKNRYIHIIATDAHNDSTRAPKLKRCYDYIAKRYGGAYARELLLDNQNKLLSGQRL